MEWTTEFDEFGGYDCMTGAWWIKDPSGALVAAIYQSRFGENEPGNKWLGFRSKEAERIAREIVRLLNAAAVLGRQEEEQ